MDPAMLDLIAVGAAALAGVVLGPWLTEVVERAPNRERVPVPFRSGSVSVVDRDRRRNRDLAVRVLAPIVLALAAARWGWSMAVFPYLVLYAALLVLSVIDIEHHRLPDNVVFPTLALSTGLIIVISTILDSPARAVPALVGAAVYFVLLGIPWFVYPKGLGFGDVKLSAVLGLPLGWIYAGLIDGVALILYSLIVACAIGVVIGIGVTIARRKRAEFPFGPALALGTIAVISFSDRILGYA
jgi:leader peptidase (prepilin peptidase)/N-methyltransferase